MDAREEKAREREALFAELDQLLATVNDDMKILLLRWACCMQKPRAKNWEKTADDLCIATRLLLGNLSAAARGAAEAKVEEQMPLLTD